MEEEMIKDNKTILIVDDEPPIREVLVYNLKKEGYNVSRTGTTTSTSKTIIANKKDVSTTAMNEIKEVIGTGTISDRSSGESSSAKADVTIIIGKDYQ